nr:glutamate racemase [Mobiluncus mulieris]
MPLSNPDWKRGRLGVNNAPIGIFDSGLGGLTVARAIIDQLPGESVVYIGDTANSPYGTKPVETVKHLALNVMDKLVEHGVKILVIACNTASAAVLFDARARYDRLGIPVLEVISPAVHRAVSATHNGKIGVIATSTTIATGTYQRALGAYQQVEVTAQACPAFVEFVERGITSGSELLAKAREYLEPVKAGGVDTLVLGCTHYPLLTGVINYVMGSEVTLVSSSEETARDVYRTLLENDWLNEDDATGEINFSALNGGESGAVVESDSPVALKQSNRYQFLATGNTEVFTRLARRFLGPEVGVVNQA